VRARPLSLPLLLSLAGVAPAADWSLAPSFSAAGEYNSNPYLGSQVDHSSGATLDAMLPLGARTERTDFALSLGGHLRRYNNDPQGNRDDESLNLSLGQTHERSGWKSSAGWTRDTTLTSELGTTGITQANRRHNRYDASIAPQIQLSPQSLFAFGISGQLNRYQDAAFSGLVDYAYASVFASYSRQISEITALGFGVSGSGLSVPDRRASEAVNGLVRVTLSHQYTERLSLEAYAGPTFARTRTLDRWGAAGRIGLKYAGLRTDFSVSAERQLSPAGLGNLNVQESAALGMSNRLTEKLSVGTSLAYQRSRDALYAAGAQPYRVYYWRVEESLHWQLAETFATSLSVNATRQDASTQSNYADRFVASLSFRWTPRPLF
jgi:hypothetical protein